MQRVVGKDLENLRGSSKSSLGRYAVFRQSFGVGSLSHEVPNFSFVRERHSRALTMQSSLVGSQVTVGPLVGQ
jgi:hypothetical protein